MKDNNKLISKVYKITWTTGKSELLSDLPSEAIYQLLCLGAKVELYDLIYEGDERCVKVQENN